MKLTIEIDLATDNREHILQVASLLNSVTNASRRAIPGAQPQVVDNSGSVSTGVHSDLSPGADAGEQTDEVEGSLSPEASSGAVTEQPAKARRGRPAKVKEADVAPTTEKPAAPEPSKEPAKEAQAAPAAEGLTIDDARTALQGVVERKDMAAAMAIVADFGAARISEVPAEKFADFIEACEAVK